MIQDYLNKIQSAERNNEETHLSGILMTKLIDLVDPMKYFQQNPNFSGWFLTCLLPEERRPSRR